MKNIKSPYAFATLIPLVVAGFLIIFYLMYSQASNSHLFGDNSESTNNATGTSNSKVASDSNTANNSEVAGDSNTANNSKDAGDSNIANNSEVADDSKFSSGDENAKDFIIVIDPGHGGYDPGKVSDDGIKEKEINLAISQKLYEILTQMGFSVFMTRDTDISLDSENETSKKSSDLQNRLSFASNSQADLYISIHQNSYSAPSVHGAQVFYYETSSVGKSLAEIIQAEIISQVDSSNTRAAKGNSEYLVLKDSHCTSIIVECGFLSNSTECALLCNEEYQKSMATAIANGVCSWVERSDNTQ
jgi:N-acetylmuramoyl-L-alanine amidase